MDARIQEFVADLLLSRNLRESFEKDPQGVLLQRGLEDSSATHKLSAAGLERAARSTIRKRMERLEKNLPLFFRALKAKVNISSHPIILDIPFGAIDINHIVTEVSKRSPSLGDACGYCLTTLMQYDLIRASLSEAAPGPLESSGERTRGLTDLANSPEGREIMISTNARVLSARVDLNSLIAQIQEGAWKCSPRDVLAIVIRSQGGHMEIIQTGPQASACVGALRSWTPIKEFYKLHPQTGPAVVQALSTKQALVSRDPGRVSSR